MIEMKKFTRSMYDAVCDFLIELNKDRRHINWNFARFEWMMEHPEYDQSTENEIGVWFSDGKVVGLSIYDMYYGEGFAAVLPAYLDLYPEVIRYAYENLRDEGGFGFTIEDSDHEKIKLAEENGFIKADQDENMMKISFSEELLFEIPVGVSIRELDPKEEPEKFSFSLWQGFDHGEDYEEFKKEELVIQDRKHLKKELSLVAETSDGRPVSYVCVWYSEKTDYAYVEPVCTAPSYRGKGLAKALLFTCLNRVKAMGAKEAYVISDMEFYQKLGFKNDKHFTFYWKE